jgi:hypothetical protein
VVARVAAHRISGRWKRSAARRRVDREMPESRSPVRWIPAGRIRPPDSISPMDRHRGAGRKAPAG